ncbi:MAG: uroporphyrinogen decarboxylase [Anaerolineales bacterium]|nr:uroporphyrinogen decarboxylase [Anaerolineae bacterium]PWB50942.1 MAG: uroporphyrinogen decarboxylase [Anaerolineales bacterium]
MGKKNITHRERIEKCLNGESREDTPVALWRHFPVDDQSPESLANAVISFQKTYDFDLVKVTPASSFCIKDWGAEDEWQGNSEGTRQYTRRVIHTPEDWLKLPVLDPYKGYLGEQLSCLKIICNELGPDVPILQTIFSPLAQAKNLVGGEALLVHIRQYPEAVLAGLKVIAETTRSFIEAASQTGNAGVFYAVQHGNYQLLSEAEYKQFGKMLDLEILSAVRDKWLNMIHLHGNHVMFNVFTDYPVQVINWHDRETYPSLKEGKELFPGVVCGGLQRTATMELGTPEHVHSEARDAILSTANQRFILGTGCVLQTTTPSANILAALQAARHE